MKISIHEPMPLSAVSYYRSIGTLSFLPKLNKDIEIAVPEQISWGSLIDTDIFYMERPQGDNELISLELAKDFNIPIWVDYDDCLHTIPDYNPCYKNYFNDKSVLLKNVEKALKLANVVTVSTPAIKDYYSKFNSNIHVIENAHNDYKYPFEKVTDTFDSINWRGSATHKNDILSVANDIFRIGREYDKWGFVFIGNGDYMWFLKDNLRNKFNIEECCTVTYNKFIKDARAAIQIVPLLNNDFNKSKSNISWIEGTYVGSCSIVPEYLPEFDKPGAIKYTENEWSFYYKLEKAIKSKPFRQKQYLESYEYIKENLMLSDVNKKRINIIEGLK